MRGSLALRKFLSAETAPRLSDGDVVLRRKTQVVILSFAILFLFVALARPQYGVKPVEVKNAGIDVMILMDTSKSMGARDVTPNRLARAKAEVGKIVSALEGNRMGLISFAGASFVECPLTMDISTLRMFLNTVKVGSIPVPGTAIGEAIADAVKALKGSRAKTKVVLLVTDGENLEGQVESSAKAALENGIVIYPIGIGSSAGAPVPEIGDDGRIKGYKKDKNGATVVSRLDVDTLKSIADITGGRLITSQGERLDLSSLVAHLKSLEKTDITSREFTEYEERYQWFALTALLLLVLESLFVSRAVFWQGDNA